MDAIVQTRVLPRYVLGISAFYHDSAACLLEDGVLVAAAQEERFTRRRHDHGFPSNAVAYCLKEARLIPDTADPTELDLSSLTTSDLVVAFYDKPWLKFERLLETYVAFAPRGLPSFLKSMPLWLKEKMWMDQTIKHAIGYEGPIYYPEHHQSHAASAFFPSPFEHAAVLTVDGVGEWATATWGRAEGTSVVLGNELKFPHSLGLLYTAFTSYIGFRVNSGEYKVMGLAPYGKPKYAARILDHLMDLKDDGSFRLDMRYFNYCTGLTMTSPDFHDLFEGEPRRPESLITQRDMDLAASIQVVVEEVMLRMARHVRVETGERNLCLAGGVALNCVANGKIQRSELFDAMWIQPAAGDAGGSVGAALHVWHHVLGNPRHSSTTRRVDRMSGCLLGPKWTSEKVASWLDGSGIPYHSPGELLLDVVSELLDEGHVVGWFSGRMEFGPRALGSRSILGDPRKPEMQSVINLKVKQRESFRPFAPAVLAEYAADFFDLDVESPYMLLVAPVAMSHRTILGEEGNVVRHGLDKLHVVRSDVPAVTHVDYSARIQTVGEEANPRFRALLERFNARTGCPVLVNTSFNVRGEPIVCTPEDAYNCFMRTGIDVLVLEDLVLYKHEQPEPIRGVTEMSFNPD